jgi:hypothetical protein
MLGRKQSVEGAAFARGFFKRRDLRSRTGHRAPTTKVGRDGGAAAPYLLPTLNTGGKAGTIPSMGPIAIFDKSALQALNMDEAVWFDVFFSANVTPPLYVETLADSKRRSMLARPERAFRNARREDADRRVSERAPPCWMWKTKGPHFQAFSTWS